MRRILPGLLWTAAVVLTLALGLFQRMTGPSWPVRGSAELAGRTFRDRLARSHGGAGDLAVRLAVPAPAAGTLEWRRYPTADRYHVVPLERAGEALLGAVPHQPPAGKVEYRVRLNSGSDLLTLPPTGVAVARFRGAVPGWVLVPHIVAMFLSMLLATRATLGAVARQGEEGLRRPVLLAMALLILGGLLLGPLVQKYAFGAYWTGWPVGTDLTDTKTLVAALAWLPATVAAWRGTSSRLAILLGWVVMMGIFLIPHSMFGSQLDWADTPGTPPASRPG